MTADQIPTPPADQGTDPADAAGTPPADQDQGKPASRQERRDQQARERATELEGQVTTLSARLDARDTAEVARLAGAILAQGGDLLALGGVSLADLRDENGDLDADEVAALAAALAETRPGLAVPKQRGHRDWGHSRDSSHHAPGGTGAQSWAGAFGAAGQAGGRHYT